MPHEDGQEDARLLDQALGSYSRDSVLTLLRGALDSPGCARVRDHLLLAWSRALASPSREGPQALAGDLPGVLHAALRADPARGITTGRVPSDPADAVRFTLGDRSYLVHPGELDHPLMVLRALRGTADAVDEHMVEERGFGIRDVLELALRHSDHAVRHLAPVWPPATDAEPAHDESQAGSAEKAGIGRTGVGRGSVGPLRCATGRAGLRTLAAVRGAR